MAEIFWTKPVKVATGRGYRTVHGPLQALECLDDWRGGKGRFYCHARDICRSALAAPEKAGKAREAFVAAHLDAAIPFA
jgi:Protein of unknown function (DUF982)